MTRIGNQRERVGLGVELPFEGQCLSLILNIREVTVVRTAALLCIKNQGIRKMAIPAWPPCLIFEGYLRLY
jgi:hypothetical protein